MNKPKLKKRIRIRFQRLPYAWGYAYPDKNEIVLDDRLDDKTLIDIAAHETTHLVVPDLDEAAVDRLGKQIADVLWRMGFRRED